MASQPRSILWPAGIVGFGLSGFFDGILLHQMLQWHHLLSLVPGEEVQDLGTQILADGLFHVLMYIVTAAGLWMLFRRREQLRDLPGGGRSIAGAALLGFGIWNFIDVGFFHWILGIHRIRVDVPDPMTYDLGWLVLFGILPALAGWRLLRQGGSGRGPAAAATLSVLALVAAPIAARPQPNIDTALVLFAPGTSAGEAVNAVMASDARIVWADPRGRMMAVSLDAPGTALRLYGQGALLVTRSPALAGCVAALRA